MLGALRLVFHRDRLAAAGGRFPVDALELIVGRVVAQPLELGAGAKHFGVAQAKLGQQPFAGQQIVLAHVEHIGVDPHVGGGRIARLANKGAQRRAIPQINVAPAVVAARNRRDMVA